MASTASARWGGTHPGEFPVDTDKLATILDGIYECAKTCAACADVCRCAATCRSFLQELGAGARTAPR